MSILIGLTGQTGSGKTTACEYFFDRGFGIINGDKVSREITTVDSPCLNTLAAEFSAAILNDDKTLNRKSLGEIVFTDSESLEKLNKIMYPAILNRINELIDDLSKSFDIIILDAPTLFESGADKLCDKIAAITVSEKSSVMRIVKRDNIDKKVAKGRFTSQHDIDFFKSHCDYVIENNGSQAAFMKKISALADCLLSLSK